MFTFDVVFDAKGLENQLEERFGIGSDAQYRWSEIVFNDSIPYMPAVTGTFINQCYLLSEPLFDQGELLYAAGDANHGYAHYLWEGILYVDPDYGKGAFYNPDFGFWSRPGVSKVPTSKPLEYNDGVNDDAGPRWVERAAADLYPRWVSEMQGLIDAGKV